MIVISGERELHL